MRQSIASAKRIFEIIEKEICEDIVNEAQERIDYSQGNALIK